MDNINMILIIIITVIIIIIIYRNNKYIKEGFRTYYPCELLNNINNESDCNSSNKYSVNSNRCNEKLGDPSIYDYCKVCKKLGGNIKINPKERSIHNNSLYGNPTCTCPFGFEFQNDKNLVGLMNDGKLYMRKGLEVKDYLVKYVNNSSKNGTQYYKDLINKYKCINIAEKNKDAEEAQNELNKNRCSEKGGVVYNDDCICKGGTKLTKLNDGNYIDNSEDKFSTNIFNDVNDANYRCVDIDKNDGQFDLDNVFKCTNYYSQNSTYYGIWSEKYNKCYAYENGTLKLPSSFNIQDSGNWFINDNNDPFWRDKNFIAVKPFRDSHNNIIDTLKQLNTQNSNELNEKINKLNSTEQKLEEINITLENWEKDIAYLTNNDNMKKNKYNNYEKEIQIKKVEDFTKKLKKYLDTIITNYDNVIKDRKDINAQIFQIKKNVENVKNFNNLAKITDFATNNMKSLYDTLTDIKNVIVEDVKLLINNYSKYINDLKMENDNKYITLQNQQIMDKKYNKIDETKDIILYTKLSNRFIKLNYSFDVNGNVDEQNINLVNTPYYLHINSNSNDRNSLQQLENLFDRIELIPIGKNFSLKKDTSSNNQHMKSYIINTDVELYGIIFRLNNNNTNTTTNDFKLLNKMTIIITNENGNELYENSLGEWLIGDKKEQGYKIRNEINKKWGLEQNVNNDFPMLIKDNDKSYYQKKILLNILDNKSITEINVPVNNMELEVYDNDNKITYLRQGKHKFNNYIKDIKIKNTPPVRTGSELSLIGSIKSLDNIINNDINKENQRIDNQKQLLLQKQDNINKQLINKETNICSNVNNTTDESIKTQCNTGVTDITEGFDNELKIRSIVNSDEISIIPMGNDKFNVQINGKCLTVYGDKDYKLNDCVKTNSQAFKKHLIRDKYDSKYMIGKLGSNNVDYPYEMLSSEITNSCLTIDPDGISVQPCIPEDKKQHWISSMNAKKCIMDER